MTLTRSPRSRGQFVCPCGVLLFFWTLGVNAQTPQVVSCESCQRVWEQRVHGRGWVRRLLWDPGVRPDERVGKVARSA
jgi:hypothetical protein